MTRMPVLNLFLQVYLLGMYHDKDTCLGYVMTRIPV